MKSLRIQQILVWHCDVLRKEGSLMQCKNAKKDKNQLHIIPYNKKKHVASKHSNKIQQHSHPKSNH